MTGYGYHHWHGYGGYAVKIEELAEEFPWTGSEGRSDTLHLSTIIHDLLETLFNTQASRAQKEKATESVHSLQYEKGFLWEVALSRALGEKAAIRPGEVVVDGVSCSPDGIGFDDDGNLYVEEYKATAMSSNKPVGDILRWIMQVKAYCYVMETTVAVFRVLYLMGDYKGGGPEYRVYRIEFSESELADNWVSLLNHAKSKGWLK